MRKYIISIILTILAVMNINAQMPDLNYSKFNGKSDGFFENHYRENVADEYDLLLLPQVHGLEYNYPADDVPIGYGLLLLSAFGILYEIKKRH